MSEFVGISGYDADVGGSMDIGATSAKSENGTLDESIQETVLRDLKAVGHKFLSVLYPKKGENFLREWDLWGPLVLCTFLAIMLKSDDSTGANGMVLGDGGPEFAEVFMVVWLVSLVITINSKLLGGQISFFQSVCVLGYCLLPPCLSLAVCHVILASGHPMPTMRAVIAAVGALWASWSAVTFLRGTHQPSRATLGAYPVCLFYCFVGWMVASST